ncbi:MliC family protein [Microbulbifer guangxiensis]|uniref:MliC family protein n=1 Tax=Microbulbifer guangxiensis TaxID=2904249 RepID=UPI001F380719|nr:MliC family protein [Microbulbifer guangxiensis]
MLRRVSATLLLAVPLLHGCEGGSRQIDTQIRTVNYECGDGTRLQVKYGKPESGPSMAMLTFDNKLVPMHQEPAASGVLFVADKGHPDYRWHTKEDSAALSLRKSGEREFEVILYDCQSIQHGATGETRS